MRRSSTLFSLWTLQACLAFGWLALLPSDAEHAVLFGFSASRLGLLGIIAILAMVSALLARSVRQKEPTLRPAQHDMLYLLAALIAVLAPAVILALRALGQTAGFAYSAYADRLAPLACWFMLSALEFVVLLAWEGRDEISPSLKPAKDLFLFIFSFLLALALIAIFIVSTRLGLTPYRDGSWGSPTTPLLEWQILLALGFSLFLMAAGARWKWLAQDRWPAIGVYLLTCLLWLSQPVNPGWFATAPRAPNFEIYPFSDALIYAQYAQSALIGHGFLWPDVPTRPLYIAFLTWLHALAGQDYTHVILLQTLVLAAFPAVLYLLGKELAGRPLGIGLAILAAFRDLTANIAAPFANNYTYSKLYFSEIPAALLICLFTLMTIHWMRENRPPWYALLAGGVLGICSLVRLQSVVLLLAVIPIGFLVIHNRRKWARDSALMALGLALALAPWLARNAAATGGLVLDNPISQAMVLARRWSGDNGNDLIPQLAGETTAQFTSRMTGIALDNLRHDPGRILGSALNHFFNNEIGNLLVFPLRDRLEAPAELLWPQHAFWQTWDAQPTAGQIPVIMFYLFLLGLGLAAAVYKNGWVGLLPFGLSLVYNAWTALFLSSGDRFLVPIDWAAYLYHFLGLLTLTGLILTGLRGARENVVAWISFRYNDRAASELRHERPVKRAPSPVSWRKTAFTAALILLAGSTLPLTEWIFPKITPAGAPIDAPGPGQVVLYGRAIYPRYYEAGQGEPGSAKLGYGKADQARLVFYLLGEQNTLVIFPLGQAPAFFPNTADVTILGKPENGFVLAQKIVVTKDDKSDKYVP